jgi:hypothetical protein
MIIYILIYTTILSGPTPIDVYEDLKECQLKAAFMNYSNYGGDFECRVFKEVQDEN